jgi:putative peptidoglycan lipid II flippase
LHELPLTLRLALLAGTNLVAGFLMQWYVLLRLGPGIATDALFAGMAVPQLLVTIVAGSSTLVIVPLLAGERDDQLRQDGWHIAVLAVVFYGVLAVILGILAPYWTRLVAPFFSLEARSLMVALTRIQLVGMVFTALAGVLWAVHRARMQFLWPETALLVWGIPRYGVFAAAWAQVLRVAIHALLLVPALGAYTRPTFRTAKAREAWRRLKPLMAGNAYLKTEPLFDRILSSLGSAGDLSLYYVGQQLSSGLVQVSNNAFVGPMVSTLSVHVNRQEWGALRHKFGRSLRSVLLLAAVALSLALAAGATVVLTRALPDAAQSSSVRIFVLIVAGLGGAIVAGPAIEVVRGAFYSTGETRLPVRVDVLSFTIGMLLKSVGFRAFGIVGLAMAASIQATLNLIILVRLFKRIHRERIAC